MCVTDMCRKDPRRMLGELTGDHLVDILSRSREVLINEPNYVRVGGDGRIIKV
jgi:hypothetical protein